MPKYRNVSNENKVLESNIVPPNEEVSTLVWYPDLPTGLEQVSDEPMFNPIVYSDEITEDTVVSVPADLRDFLIDLYVATGNVEVRFSSDANNPPLKLGDGMSWSRKFVNRIVNDIRIKFISAGSVWVNIERV